MELFWGKKGLDFKVLDHAVETSAFNSEQFGGFEFPAAGMVQGLNNQMASRLSEGREGEGRWDWVFVGIKDFLGKDRRIQARA